MMKVSFEVDTETWEDYRAYAESCGKTTEEMLNRHIICITAQHMDRIMRYKRGKNELIRSLDEEDRK